MIEFKIVMKEKRDKENRLYNVFIVVGFLEMERSRHLNLNEQFSYKSRIHSWQVENTNIISNSILENRNSFFTEISN